MRRHHAILIFALGLAIAAAYLALPRNGDGKASRYTLPDSKKAPDLSTWEANNVDVYRAASPGVVHVTSVALHWDYFYNVVPSQGTGSGAIIDDKGHVITNLHVIRRAQRVFVTLADGSRYPARVVGADPSADLAVLRIEAPAKSLTPIPLGTSKGLLVGQKVLAIGNPFGLERTLTTGIISSLGRSLRTDDGRVIQNLIQTDAAINPGNSGGPLLNSAGQIIGINTAIFSPSGGNVGIGFAVPVDRAKRVLPDLITFGRTRQSWLGVRLFTLSPDVAKYLGLPVRRGVLVVETVRGGPAHRHGLRGGSQRVRIGNVILSLGGDIITAIDGKAVTTSDQLVERLDSHGPGDRVTLTVVRPRGEIKRIPVVLGDRPDDY